MLLQIIEGKFSVCKVENLRAVNFHVPWLFVGKTDAEISVVCLTVDVPHATLAREDARAHERKPSVLGRLKSRPPEAAAGAVKKTKEPSL